MEIMDGGQEERVAKMFADLESRADKLGLYLEHGVVTKMPGQEEEENPERLMVMATFSIGDRAFTKQVQDPEQHEFDEQFREIRESSEDEEITSFIEELRGQIKDDDD